MPLILRNGAIFWLVVELLFCLPIANGRVERVFSLLKLIKDNQRTCLKEDTLDHLLRIKEEGPPLAEWDASRSVELWWSKESCRVKVQQLSTTCNCAQETEAEASSDAESEVFSLDKWEEWISSDHTSLQFTCDKYM